MSISKKIFMFLIFATVAVPVSCEQFFAVGKKKKSGGGSGSIDIYKVGEWENQAYTLTLEKNRQPTKLVFSPDGKYLACIDDKKKATIYEWKNNTWDNIKQTYDNIVSVAFSPDGKLFAYSSAFVADKGSHVSICKAPFSGGLKYFDKVEDGVTKIGFTKSGYLVGYGGDKIYRWKVENSSSMQRDEISKPNYIVSIEDIAVSPNSDKFILVGTYFDRPIFGDMQQFRKIKSRNVTGKKWSTVENIRETQRLEIALSPSGKSVAWGFLKPDGEKCSEKICVKSLALFGKKKRWSVPRKKLCKQLAFSFDDKYIARLFEDKVRILEVNAGKNTPLSFEADLPTAIAFGPEIDGTKAKKTTKKKKTIGDISSSPFSEMFEDLSSSEELPPNEE